ncbi:MAG: GNAT family N-acetyltransferase [Actinomycetaceae bacterium]|nr:GNAT family N-acetyltransferase [Actinomycetaceae bacterium]
MAVELVTEYNDEFVPMMQELIPQLSSSSVPFNEQQIKDFLAQPGMFLFIFRSDNEADNGRIVGMLSLATFVIPTGMRAWIEDVVVDSAARGQGAGQKLTEAAIQHAQKIGAKSVDLTSRPTREAANRLYKRCGFEVRETNVYRYKA